MCPSHFNLITRMLKDLLQKKAGFSSVFAFVVSLELLQLEVEQVQQVAGVDKDAAVALHRNLWLELRIRWNLRCENCYFLFVYEWLTSVISNCMFIDHFKKHDIPLTESFQLFVNSYFTRSKLVWTVIPCSRQDNRTQEFQAAAISSSS